MTIKLYMLRSLCPQGYPTQKLLALLQIYIFALEMLIHNIISLSVLLNNNEYDVLFMKSTDVKTCSPQYDKDTFDLKHNSSSHIENTLMLLFHNWVLSHETWVVIMRHKGVSNNSSLSRFQLVKFKLRLELTFKPLLDKLLTNIWNCSIPRVRHNHPKWLLLFETESFPHDSVSCPFVFGFGLLWNSIWLGLVRSNMCLLWLLKRRRRV